MHVSLLAMCQFCYSDICSWGTDNTSEMCSGAHISRGNIYHSNTGSHVEEFRNVIYVKRVKLKWNNIPAHGSQNGIGGPPDVFFLRIAKNRLETRLLGSRCIMRMASSMTVRLLILFIAAAVEVYGVPGDVIYICLMISDRI